MTTLTREQCQKVDKLASEQLGIPGIVLMENASRNAADVILAWMSRGEQAADHSNVALLIGGGNNGGDGYAIARHLTNHGHHVHIYALKPVEQLDGDAATNATIARNMDIPIDVINDEKAADGLHEKLAQTDLIVDALLGTGFKGDVRSPMSEVIKHANASGVPIAAIDVPSGFDCDAGTPSNATIKAEITITFVAEKVGFKSEQAPAYLGETVVCDIGAPMSLIDQVCQ